MGRKEEELDWREVGRETYNQLPRPPFKEWKERANSTNQTNSLPFLSKRKESEFNWWGRNDFASLATLSFHCHS